MNKKQKEKDRLKFYPTEKVEILPYRRTAKGYRYAVTSHGRVIRFKTKPEEGEFLKQYPIVGYPGVFIMANGVRKNALIHRLVAMAFLPKPARNQVFVIHKDRDVNNNHYSNLKWVDKEEHVEHAKKSPRWIASYRHARNVKLTEGQVRLLKKKIKEGKTRLRLLAKQFGVTDMQLYRIKWGENWGWVK
jgi:hypothetical protein